MERVLTAGGGGVTLTENVEPRFSRRKGRSGQAAVEYLLMMMALVVCFASMYGFLQGQVKRLFMGAAVMILRVYGAPR